MVEVVRWGVWSVEQTEERGGVKLSLLGFLPTSLALEGLEGFLLRPLLLLSLSLLGSGRLWAGVCGVVVLVPVHKIHEQ